MSIINKPGTRYKQIRSRFLMTLPPFTNHLTSFKIQKYYLNESELNRVFSRNNLPKLKDGAYVRKHDEFKPIETY